MLKSFILILLILFWHFFSFSNDYNVRLGADIFFEKYLTTVVEKRVGVICNHTSLLSNGVHIVDSLINRGIKITALFSPEHGIRGIVPAGVKIENQIDEKTGLLVFSLYGKNKRPNSEMLNNIDVLIYDIQDVGARFYTYYITMLLAMESAAEYRKPFIVLDRPNPINGIDVEGPVLNMSLKSDVGIVPLPIRHGLTIGEIAQMAVGEKWIADSINLTVVKMTGWERNKYFDEIKLKWLAPSPNMRSISTAVVYPGTCLLEGTNVSEGRGTEKPFEYVGSPWIDGKKLNKKLNSLRLKGVKFEPVEFTPKSDSNFSGILKYRDTSCSGVFIKVTDRKNFKPVLTGIYIMKSIYQLYPDKFVINEKYFDRLAGIQDIRNFILSKKKIWTLNPKILKDFKYYLKIRLNYLIY